MIMCFFIHKLGWTGETRSANEARDDTTQKAQNPAQRQEGYQVLFAVLRTAALGRCSYLAIFSSQKSPMPISTAFPQPKLSVLIQVLTFLAAILFFLQIALLEIVLLNSSSCAQIEMSSTKKNDPNSEGQFPVSYLTYQSKSR